LYAPTTDYDGSAHQGVQYLRNQRGIPKEKIHLGMPFYGKECNASRLYGAATSWSDLEYTTIAPRLKSGWDYFWDQVSKVPYLLNANRTKFVTFDDSLSLSFKCEYAKTNGLGGVMIWALGQDAFVNAQPLMEAVGIAMGKTAEEKNQIAEKFELFNNYPNPFNARTTIEFQLDRDTPVSLSVYTLTGELVTVLKNGMAARGRNKLTWEATGQASGIYFSKLEAAGFSDTKKMILVR
jgi:GH18 family chitinase